MEHKNLIIFIIVAAVIIALVYFVALQNQLVDMEEVGIPVTDDTSITAIEKDLSDTNVDNFDEEFLSIDAELEAAVNEAR